MKAYQLPYTKDGKTEIIILVAKSRKSAVSKIKDLFDKKQFLNNVFDVEYKLKDLAVKDLGEARVILDTMGI